MLRRTSFTNTARLALLAFLPAMMLAQAPNQPKRKKMPRPPAAWLDPVKMEPAGTHYQTFSSKLAGGEVSYLVYLPPAYEADSKVRFPVVYWLHGMGGNQRGGAKFV